MDTKLYNNFINLNNKNKNYQEKSSFIISNFDCINNKNEEIKELRSSLPTVPTINYLNNLKLNLSTGSINKSSESINELNSSLNNEGVDENECTNKTPNNDINKNRMSPELTEDVPNFEKIKKTRNWQKLLSDNQVQNFNKMTSYNYIFNFDTLPCGCLLCENRIEFPQSCELKVIISFTIYTLSEYKKKKINEIIKSSASNNISHDPKDEIHLYVHLMFIREFLETHKNALKIQHQNREKTFVNTTLNQGADIFKSGIDVFGARGFYKLLTTKPVISFINKHKVDTKSLITSISTQISTSKPILNSSSFQKNKKKKKEIVENIGDFNNNNNNNNNNNINNNIENHKNNIHYRSNDSDNDINNELQIDEDSINNSSNNSNYFNQKLIVKNRIEKENEISHHVPNQIKENKQKNKRKKSNIKNNNSIDKKKKFINGNLSDNINNNANVNNNLINSNGGSVMGESTNIALERSFSINSILNNYF